MRLTPQPPSPGACPQRPPKSTPRGLVKNVCALGPSSSALISPVRPGCGEGGGVGSKNIGNLASQRRVLVLPTAPHPREPPWESMALCFLRSGNWGRGSPHRCVIVPLAGGRTGATARQGFMSWRERERAVGLAMHGAI